LQPQVHEDLLDHRCSRKRRPHLRGITLLLAAGVQYLLLRSRTITVFGSLDLRSDADWRLLNASLRAIAGQMFAADAEAR